MSDSFESLGQIMDKRQSTTKPLVKPPAYSWQDLALTIIKELNIPNFKRSSVFKICKEQSEPIVIQAFNDTKELCTEGEKWKYFFKIISEVGKPR